MNNIVDFKTLKRKEIRKTIGKGEEQILIYNPNREQQKLINQMFLVNANKRENEVDFEITGREFLIKLLPMLTNIQLELDENNPEDKAIIEDILNDPSEILLQVKDELNVIIEEVGTRLIKTMDDIEKLPKEQLEKIIDEANKIEETPEQKEIRELKEKLAHLENKEVDDSERN